MESSQAGWKPLGLTMDNSSSWDRLSDGEKRAIAGLVSLFNGNLPCLIDFNCVGSAGKRQKPQAHVLTINPGWLVHHHPYRSP